MSTCGGWDDLVARWPMRLAIKKEQIHKERGRGHPRQGRVGKYREAEASLGGPRIMRRPYVFRWNDKEQVMVRQNRSLSQELVCFLGLSTRA